MKAMLLAAGRGERLRPITDHIPKALVEAGGKPLIGWHLERLARAGFREAVINVSHLGERIVERLGDGRALRPATALLARARARWRPPAASPTRCRCSATEPFLLVNADVYCECDFARLRGVSLGDRLAHLVLVPNPPHKAKGDFELRGGLIVGDDPAPRYTYAGVALMKPALVAPVKPGEKAALAPLLYAAAGNRRLGGELYEGLWQDVGTIERLAELEAQLQR